MPTPDNKTIFPLAIFTGGDAYSTSQKIMGRQSAGKSLIKGLALNYKKNKIQTYGANKNSAIMLGKQLTQDGFEGDLIWQKTTNLNKIQLVNTLYYPAIPLPELAHIRNQLAPGVSIVGITHTLSSLAAMEQIGNMALPPFKQWDALICTSHAALKVVQHIQNNVRTWWSEEVGATKFSNIQTPIIPLGINTIDFQPKVDKKHVKEQLGIDQNQCVIVFSGRLSFHGKSNPIPLYMCLEKIAQEYPNITCIEAGIYSNEHIEKA